ncbi:MAG TPA: GAF and ANTAR domain-containing protein [Marmoricola sp.]|nr:GAF and ANTAR domain-containing protein [Marmoricola sp.]
MSESGSEQVAEALTAAAKQIHAQGSLEETLDAIVHATLQTVPGFDHVGISIIHRNGEIETKAGTGPLVWELDRLQHELGEGPCYDAIKYDAVNLVEHARHEQRWPRYIPRAVAFGLTAQLGVRLFVEEETLGGLNLYCTSSETVPEDAVQVAELFATHAALALGRARREENLTRAIASRKSIGQALGIVMERYQIDEARALQFLIRASNTSNIKLRTVAEELVESTNQRFSAPA